ncbi:MAG TPA: hypothetical protein VMD98_02900 [Bryocella sp.]|nr:hypothetical protein [Bryocella sp.]
MPSLRSLALSVFVLICAAVVASAQTWTPLNNQPSFAAGTLHLLTDGTVLVHHEDGNSGYSDWWKLTPDINGSYVNGSWSQVASLPSNYGPESFGSAVLADGKMIIEGGEQNFADYVWTNMGAIYDPIANTWTMVNPPSGWSTIGDASTVVLANKTLMLANCCTEQQALLDESTLTWTPTGTGKFDENDEEGWVLLPNGKVLTVDCYVNLNDPNGTNSELYDPSSGSWSSAGSTVVQLWDSHGSYETGPSVLRPNGTVFATGANGAGPGNTSVYNVSTGSWTPGPTFPGMLDIADGPAALLPDGNVLVDTSPGIFQLGVQFFEFDGENLISVPGTPDSMTDSSWYGQFLMLPTGQIMYTDLSDDIYLYTPSGNPLPGLAPSAILTTAVITRGSTFRLAGFRFNGASQDAMYGDDAQNATNYPIVRLTNQSTGHVFYARTHDHSTMAVGYNGPAYTYVDVPTNMETGASYLEVVVNGIPSPRYPVGVN